MLDGGYFRKAFSRGLEDSSVVLFYVLLGPTKQDRKAVATLLKSKKKQKSASNQKGMKEVRIKKCNHARYSCQRKEAHSKKLVGPRDSSSRTSWTTRQYSQVDALIRAILDRVHRQHFSCMTRKKIDAACI